MAGTRNGITAIQVNIIGSFKVQEIHVQLQVYLLCVYLYEIQWFF